MEPDCSSSLQGDTEAAEELFRKALAAREQAGGTGNGDAAADADAEADSWEGELPAAGLVLVACMLG